MVKSLKPVLGGRELVKVAIPQISSVFLDRAASIDRATAAIREAGRNGADLGGVLRGLADRLPLLDRGVG